MYDFQFFNSTKRDCLNPNVLTLLSFWVKTVPKSEGTEPPDRTTIQYGGPIKTIHGSITSIKACHKSSKVRLKFLVPAVVIDHLQKQNIRTL